MPRVYGYAPGAPRSRAGSKGGVRPASDAFLQRIGLTHADLAGFVCHPGGVKVLDALEQAFDLDPGTMQDARDVLREHGNMSAVTVLFVLQRMLRRGLSEEGLTVDVAGEGERAVAMAGASDYDAVVLDVMLPGIDGFETCRRLRRDGVWAPVLMLTARGAIDDRVAGLDGGAADYLTKPFAFRERLARLRATARRGPQARPAVLTSGDLRLDPAARTVTRGDTPIELSPLEFSMLETLMGAEGKAESAPYTEPARG